MRISVWISDVCSSDLAICLFTASCTLLSPENTQKLEAMGCKFASLPPSQQVEAMSTISDIVQQQEEELLQNLELALQRGRMQVQDPVLQIGRASCRERVCQYV